MAPKGVIVGENAFDPPAVIRSVAWVEGVVAPMPQGSVSRVEPPVDGIFPTPSRERRHVFPSIEEVMDLDEFLMVSVRH